MSIGVVLLTHPNLTNIAYDPDKGMLFRVQNDKCTTNIIRRILPDEENIYSIIKSAISMLEDLGNAYHALQVENINLKHEIIHLEAMIED